MTIVRKIFLFTFFFNSIANSTVTFTSWESNNTQSLEDYKKVSLLVAPQHQNKIPSDLWFALENTERVEQSFLEKTSFSHPGIYKNENGDYVVASNLNVITEKQGRDLLVWVTEIQSGNNIDKVNLGLYDCLGNRFKIAQTNSSGLALFRSINVVPKCEAQKIVLIAEKKSDLSVTSTSWTKGLESWRLNVPISKDENTSKKESSIRPILSNRYFAINDELKVLHFFKKTPGSEDKFFLENNWSKERYFIPIKVLKNKKMGSSSYIIPSHFTNGDYTLGYSIGKEVEYTSYQIKVLSRGMPRGQIKIEGLKDSFYYKEKNQVKITATDWNNVPVKNGKFLINIGFDSDSKEELQKNNPEYAFYNIGFISNLQRNQKRCLEAFLTNHGPKGTYLKEIKLDSKGVAQFSFPEIKMCQKVRGLELNVEYIDDNGQIISTYFRSRVTPSLSAVGIKFLPEVENKRLKLMAIVKDNENRPVNDQLVKMTKLHFIPAVHKKKVFQGGYEFENETDFVRDNEVCQGKTNSEGVFSCYVELPEDDYPGYEAAIVDADQNMNYAFRDINLKNKPPFMFMDSTRQMAAELESIIEGDEVVFKIRTYLPFDLGNALVTVHGEKLIKALTIPFDQKKVPFEFRLKKGMLKKGHVTLTVIKGQQNETTKTIPDIKISAMAFDLTKSPEIPKNALSINAPKIDYQSDEEITLNYKINLGDFKGTDKFLKSSALLVMALDQSDPLLIENDSLALGQMFFSPNVYNLEMASNLVLNPLYENRSKRLFKIVKDEIHPYFANAVSPLKYWNVEDNLKSLEGQLKIKLKNIQQKGSFPLYVYGILLNGQHLEAQRVGFSLNITPAEKDKKIIAEKPIRIALQTNEKKFISEEEREIGPHEGQKSFQEVKQSFHPSDIYVLDRNGYIIERTRKSFEERKLHWTKLEEIGQVFLEELLTSEDAEFYEHAGVNWKSLTKVSFEQVLGLAKKRRGASTITMQLATLLKQSNNKKKSIGDKLLQIKEAMELESSWSKKEILEAYVNLAPFRGEIIGIKAASENFFGKLPAELNRMEATFLSVMLRAPNSTPDLIGKRIVTQLKNVSLDEAVKFSKKAINNNFLYQSKKQVNFNVNALPWVEESETSAYVKTSLDIDLQKKMQFIVDKHLEKYRDQNMDSIGLLIIDNESKKVISYVTSSFNVKDERFLFDSVQARRQIGSALKPLLYAAAFDAKILGPDTLINDHRISKLQKDGGVYSARNFDNSFRGEVSASTALTQSLNIPAMKVGNALGGNRLLSKLKDVGITDLRSSEYYGDSLALGAMNASLWELTWAYFTLHDGANFKDSTKDLIFDILSRVETRTNRIDSLNVLNIPVQAAMKTGTSNDNRDNWSVGWNSRYTIGVWVGNKDGEATYHSGHFNAASLWRKVFYELVDRAYNTDEVFEFKSPKALANVESLPKKLEESKKVRINYPVNGEHVLWDTTLNRELARMIFDIENYQDDMKITVNGRELKERNWPLEKGKANVILMDKNSKTLDELSFYVD